ncbi:MULTISPECIES: hypothetical protein [unclassified Clostridium]|uniref:hypothetical protein n=1 Tax=unclassified Clostridium TaxID=2614128 RepID=UPI00029850E2|nr:MULTISPECIES: hypothetical protein [unclassified Clostridium]EKQ55507.1 MAG: hypothetical protein A370_02723 [Clostridium sp. Maddingley MBC34-26]
MEKEEVELLPAGLVSCLLDGREVRILKISPEKLTVRMAEEIEKIHCIKVVFYIFDEFRYEEVIIEDYSIIEKIKDDFSLTYVFYIKNQEYLYNVRTIFKNYSNYITLKAFGDENEFSKEMVGYPAELDYEFYKYYLEQKKDWMSGLNYSGWNEKIMDSIELAIVLDNGELYKKYIHNHIKVFKKNYLKENFVDNHKLFQKDIKRIYIGNEFCHNLFPEVELLMNMMQKAKEEELGITLCFTYMRDDYIEKTKDVLHKVYSWCRKNNRSIEIVVNDFGMLKLVEDEADYFKLSLGLLLNKRKKDSRYIYKKGFMENKKLAAENILNSSIFNRFLKECKIERYEYENCGYKISIAEGCHSMHIPFYQTNTSQYCPLHAMCTTMDRGNQKLVVNCPKYCVDYVFSYPKHLKMVGRYNSLFSFDDTLLKNSKELENYINSGIDRIVLNFI